MKNIFYLSLILILAACEKEIPFDGELSEQKIVLNCYIGAGESEIFAEVSRTETVLSDKPFTFVSNATVQLFSGSALVGTFTSLGAGKYKLTYNVEAGATYTLKCTDPLLGTVEATAQVPYPVPISSLMVEPGEGFESRFDVELEFTDGASDNDFYQLLFYLDFDAVPGVWSFETNEEILRNTNEIGDNTFFYTNECLFPDNAFNNETIALSMSVFGFLDTTAKVQLIHISEEYYNYQKSLFTANQTSGNPFSQPVQVFSNIEGGIGIFAGYAVYEESLMP